MKRIYLIIYSLLLSAVAVAQPKIRVDNMTQRLGDLIFQMPKTVVYTLKNSGNRPLIISEVQPSCGCVQVQYPHEPILAGKKATITAVYDAQMMGTFHRELALYSNASEEPLYLAFEGRVVERPGVQNYEEDFPIDLGSVRMSANALEFDDVNKGDKPVVELRVVNTGDKDYSPQLMHLPPFLEAEYFPRTIRKGRVGRIRLTLLSDKLMMDGLNQASVYLARYLGDRTSGKNEVVVSAVLLPNFAHLTASQLERAPHIVLMDGDSLVKSHVSMPREGKKKKLEKTISVTNIGEEPLEIKSVQVFNSAIGLRLSERTIPAHGTAKLKITLDTRQLQKAKAQSRVLIISNDPRQAKVMLNIEE